MNIKTKRYIGKIINPLAITFLKIHTRVTGTERARMLVWNEQKELLLVKGYVGEGWTLPGGGIEKDETPLHGAIRELYEETGVSVDIQNVAPVTIFTRPDSPVAYTAHIFTVTIAANDLPSKPHNPFEIMELGWFSTDSLPDPLAPLVRPSLEKLSNSRAL